MKQYTLGTFGVAEEEQYTALQDLLTEQLSPTALKRVATCNALGVSQLHQRSGRRADQGWRADDWSAVG
jgi:hypothetical protein